ncbi:pseudouridine synthase [Paracoccus sediminilitoris]|uniref:pseudouridine synthase n=1 Tax=Paracoccus sediminilitoris TaxID=2202419 RepID=UPI00272B0BF6|nr:pseudouridine synthase [Paracoccus sediminilitoris]
MSDQNTPKKNELAKADDTDRIAKVMARAGVASRREAERMIVEGRVTVNGKKIASPALDVKPSDVVVVDGKKLDEPQETRLWLYYKPLGLITSESDELGRQTVFDALPRDLPRVMTVGRLDLNSEGLLLLTNDGDLKRRLELPSTGWLRRYRVRVNGTPSDMTFDPLRRGVKIEGEDFAPMEIKLDSQQGANAWISVGIREGKNREIRRAMAHVGLQVNRLIRIGYGPFKLTGMDKNEVVEVKRKVLRDQLGGLLTGDVEDKPREMRPRGAESRFARSEDRGDAGPRRFGDKPGGKVFGARSRDDDRGDRPARSWGDKPARQGDGERPRFQGKPGGSRPEFGDRARPAGDKPRWGKSSGDDRKPYGKPRDGDDSRPSRFAGKPGGDRKPWGARDNADGPKKPYAPRDGGDRKPWGARDNADGPKKPYAPRDGGDRKPWGARDNADGPKKPYAPRDGGDRKPWGARDNADGPKKPYAPRDGGDRKPWGARDNADGPKKPYAPRDGGDRKPWGARDNADGPKKPYAPRDGGDRKPYAPRGEGAGKPRPAGGKGFGGPRGDRPAGGGFKPGGKPGGGKPRGPRG